MYQGYCRGCGYTVCQCHLTYHYGGGGGVTVHRRDQSEILEDILYQLKLMPKVWPVEKESEERKLLREMLKYYEEHGFFNEPEQWCERTRKLLEGK